MSTKEKIFFFAFGTTYPHHLIPLLLETPMSRYFHKRLVVRPPQLILALARNEKPETKADPATGGGQ